MVAKVFSCPKVTVTTVTLENGKAILCLLSRKKGLRVEGRALVMTVSGNGIKKSNADQDRYIYVAVDSFRIRKHLGEFGISMLN